MNKKYLAIITIFSLLFIFVSCSKIDNGLNNQTLIDTHISSGNNSIGVEHCTVIYANGTKETLAKENCIVNIGIN